MQRKKKPNGLLISGLISALASLAIVAVAPSFAGDTAPKEKPEQAQAHSQAEAQGNGSNPATAAASGSEDTKGNPRKSGYEDNSKTPQEPNHGKGSDHDGDAGNDATAHEDGHEATEDFPNRHPSGKDKDGEAGGSGNQGKAESNPDDSKGPMRYEGGQGDDKPTGPGGTDRDDQDGNNGCGNDDDFNDDNNGHCGRPTEPATVESVCDADATMPGTQKCDKPDEVQGGVIAQPTCPDGIVMGTGGNCLEVNPSVPEDTVLGEQIEKDKAAAKPEGPSVLGLRLSPALNQPVKVAGAVLPFTGGDVLIFLVLALALFASGILIMLFASGILIMRSTKRSQQTS